MSTYSVNQTRYKANLNAVRAVVPHLAAISEGLTSQALEAAAQQLRATDHSLEGLTTTWGQLAAKMPASAWASLDAVCLATARDLTYAAQAAAAKGSSDAEQLAKAARASSSDALVTAAAQLARDERVVLADVACQAFTNLGYRVERRDGTTWTGVEAWKGHEVIVAALGDGGTAQVDHAGLSDGTCHDRQAAWQAEMSRLGVDLETTTGTDHGNRRGGVLIAGAGKLGRASLAGAVVELKEGPPARRRPIDESQELGRTSRQLAAGGSS